MISLRGRKHSMDFLLLRYCTFCFDLEGGSVQFTNVWRENQKRCMLGSGCLNVEMAKRVGRTLKEKPPYCAV